MNTGTPDGGRWYLTGTPSHMIGNYTSGVAAGFIGSGAFTINLFSKVTVGAYDCIILGERDLPDDLINRELLREDVRNYVYKHWDRGSLVGSAGEFHGSLACDAVGGFGGKKLAELPGKFLRNRSKSLRVFRADLLRPQCNAPARLPTGAGWTGDAGAAARYAQIVDADDVASLARNANVPENVVSSVKQHLFVTEHRIPVGPNQWRTGRFDPSDEIADLWEAAARGERIDEFRHLLGHEYLESTLMKHLNLPCRSPHPEAWIDPSDWTSMPTTRHYGAHDLAPRAAQGDLTPRQLLMWEHFLGGAK